ncbi:Cystathionine gamma-lyase [Plasmodiophora brassicae]
MTRGTEQSLATRCIHAGQKADVVTGAVTVPISLASTFAQKSPGVHTGYEYSRSGNPTRKAFEDCIADLENGKYGFAFASGSAATSTILHLLQPGDHVVTVDDVYGGTNRFFNRVAKPCMELKFDFVDLSKPGSLQKAIVPPKTKMLWLETPTNPTLKIIDIAEAAEVAHRNGLIVVVDNTFMSPYLQSPLDLGADIVVHSVSKYINGHSDVVMGVAVTSNESIAERLSFFNNAIGGIPAPFDCYMAMRGAKTLAVRMDRHSQNSMIVAQFLESHEKIDRVVYPGLASHPQHDIALKQMRGFGGMITCYLKGGLAESRTFLENLHLFKCAESLGAVECLAEHPAIMTHASVPPEQRAVLGISDTMVRLSIGIEAVEDILADLRSALDAIP